MSISFCGFFIFIYISISNAKSKTKTLIHLETFFWFVFSSAIWLHIVQVWNKTLAYTWDRCLIFQQAMRVVAKWIVNHKVQKENDEREMSIDIACFTFKFWSIRMNICYILPIWFQKCFSLLYICFRFHPIQNQFLIIAYIICNISFEVKWKRKIICTDITYLLSFGFLFIKLTKNSHHNCVYLLVCFPSNICWNFIWSTQMISVVAPIISRNNWIFRTNIHQIKSTNEMK